MEETVPMEENISNRTDSVIEGSRSPTYRDAGLLDGAA
jgi:hypothetical protein